VLGVSVVVGDGVIREYVLYCLRSSGHRFLPIHLRQQRTATRPSRRPRRTSPGSSRTTIIGSASARASATGLRSSSRSAHEATGRVDLPPGLVSGLFRSFRAARWT
jgi:hypothetical protein